LKSVFVHIFVCKIKSIYQTFFLYTKKGLPKNTAVQNSSQRTKRAGRTRRWIGPIPHFARPSFINLT